MGFKNGRSGRAFGLATRRKAKRLASETDLVGRTAKRELERELARREWPVKRVNKQDHPSGRNTASSRSRTSKVRQQSTATGVVIRAEVRSHYTGARGAAVKAILTTLGQVQRLFRTALVVRDRVGRGRQGPVRQRRITFRSNPRLAGWAARADKGSQYLRHVIQIKGETLRRLVMTATLKKLEPKIIALWQKSTLGVLKR